MPRRASPQRSSKSHYITPMGYQRLADELDYLWRVERRRVTQQVADAAALGDRSENAEYIYGKKRLREIDRRLRWLSKRLDELEIVHPHPSQRGRVFFGAYVTVEDEEGDELALQIVGADEVDPNQRKISIDSPMGRALLGKAVGDEVLVRRPKGEASFEVVKIRYEGVAER
ncbi:MAG: transcription elongation factor GreB [Deltaproteobacteria bacterium]|nr:MAG: transcription elongation factor GreB [Pseudomonadota bacterium]PIE66389.1 MAG: transcription elongation factor GreB [Deltaproteobacteria bacterium]